MEPQRWGYVKLVDEYCPKIMHPDPFRPGEMYDTGDEGPATWVLLCDCGEQFEILKEDFPGRRKLRDCQGRNPECEFWKENQSAKVPKSRRAKLGRPPIKTEPSALVTVYLPLRLLESLGQLSAELGISRSSLVAEMLKVQMAVYEKQG
jgi:hypothetical protein